MVADVAFRKTLRRVFEHDFGPWGGNLNKQISKSLNAQGVSSSGGWGVGGRRLKLQIDQCIMLKVIG